MSEKHEIETPSVDQRTSTWRGKAKALAAVSIACALLWTVSPRFCSKMPPTDQSVTADELLQDSPMIGRDILS